jgi:predicted cupin superfamily sugar epimerase
MRRRTPSPGRDASAVPAGHGPAGGAGASTPPATAERLGLTAHPEGGWYRRTWTAPVDVDGRPAATAVLYLLAPGERSARHVLDADELWLWHGPGPVVLRLGDAGRPVPLDAGHPQVLVPARTWQTTDTVDTEVLVSCVVSPGFEWSGFRLG